VKYEVQLLLVAIPLVFLGVSFLLTVIGRRPLPERNPFHLHDSLRRSVLAMVCSFILSPGLLILYIWALRVGLIR
jgi:hypothetical protein